MRNWILIGVAVLVLAILAGFAYLIYQGMESYETTYWTPPEGEARVNRFLAAERFLNKMGVPAESDYMLPRDGLPPNSLVIVGTRREGYTKKRIDDLLNWVYDGGRLVVVGNEDEDYLISKLGLAVDAASEMDAENPWTEQVNEMLFGSSSYQSKLCEPHCEVEFSDARTLMVYGDDIEYRLLVGEEDDSKAVLFYFGNGWVTVCSDLRFMRNRYIGELDHARFLHQLVTLNGPVDKVYIFFQEIYPSIWSLLIRKSWMGLISLVLFIVVVIWFAARRHGPLLPDDPLARRRLSEHVEGSGRFWWRSHRGELLVESTREALWQQIRLRHGGWVHLKKPELTERLSEVSGLSAADITFALDQKTVTDEGQFLRLIHKIETLRRTL